jgi:WXG100 family type VII secretion target
MSLISEIEGVFDPGGDPAAIRQAASNISTMATSLRGSASTLDHVAAVLGKTWKGKESSQDESAAQAFQKSWANLSAEIKTYAENHDSVASALNQIADEIENAQKQAAHLKEMALLAVAVATATALFSFGASELAAAAEVAADSAEGISLMTALGEVLSDGSAVLDAIIQALTRVAARFLMGAVFSWASEAYTKHKEGLDPFDVANYSAADFGNILLGGALTAAMGEAGSKIGPLKTFLTGSPIRGALAYGALGGGLGSAISQKVIEGESIDWTKVLESAAVSGGTGFLMGSAAKGISMYTGTNNAMPNLLPDPPNPLTAATGITGGDVLRGSIGIPSGAIFYLLNFPKAGAAPTLPSGQQEQFTDPSAAAPPTVAVVKEGSNLWEITGGSQQQIQQIAKLDGIPHDSLIFPGEVLISPSSSGSSG